MKDSEVNQYIGKSSGGRTTKIHAIVDGLVNPLYIKLTAGQVQDSTQTVGILSQLDIKGATYSQIKHTEQRKFENT